MPQLLCMKALGEWMYGGGTQTGKSKATGGESKVVAVTGGQICWWRSVKWGGKAMSSQPRHSVVTDWDARECAGTGERRYRCSEGDAPSQERGAPWWEAAKECLA